MTTTHHRGSPIWIAVFALCGIVFGSIAGYGLSCARASDEVCQSVWGLAAGTVAVYGWVFAGLALLALGATALLASSELMLRDDGLTLRHARWRHDYRLEDLGDFQFTYTNFFRMYRIRSKTTKKTLVLASFFERFDEVEQWIAHHLEQR